MKRRKTRHVNPGELREETGFFGGDYSVDMWDEINKLKDSSPDAWDALYTIGCRLQEFEAFVRRRITELRPESTLDEKLIKEGTLYRNDDMLRFFYELTPEEIGALQKSHNRKKKKS